MTALPGGGLPVRRVERVDGGQLGPGDWPATIPAVRQLLREGLDLGPVAVLVGENGSGTSTIVEALAAAYGPTDGVVRCSTNRSAAAPGARIRQLDEDGYREGAWSRRTAGRDGPVGHDVARKRFSTRTPKRNASSGTRSSTPWNMPAKSSPSGSRSGANP